MQSPTFLLTNLLERLNQSNPAWINIKKINELRNSSGFPDNPSRFPELGEVGDRLGRQQLKFWVRIRQDLDEQLDPSHQSHGSPDGRVDRDLTEDPERSGFAFQVVRLQEVGQNLVNVEQGSDKDRLDVKSRLH